MLISCGEKNCGQIELLQLDQGEIRVAECMVVLPPREAKLGHRRPPPQAYVPHACPNPA